MLGFFIGLAVGIGLYKIVVINSVNKMAFTQCDLCKWKNRDKSKTAR